MAKAELRITLDRDWLALNAYRMVLEAIVREHKAEPWGFSGETAAALAEMAMRQFPGSFRGRGDG